MYSIERHSATHWGVLLTGDEVASIEAVGDGFYSYVDQLDRPEVVEGSRRFIAAKCDLAGQITRPPRHVGTISDDAFQRGTQALTLFWGHKDRADWLRDARAVLARDLVVQADEHTTYIDRRIADLTAERARITGWVGEVGQALQDTTTPLPYTDGLQVTLYHWRREQGIKERG